MDEQADRAMAWTAADASFIDMTGRPATLAPRVRHHLTLLIEELRELAVQNGHALSDKAFEHLGINPQTTQYGAVAQQRIPLPGGPKIHYHVSSTCVRCRAFPSATLTVRAETPPDQLALEFPEESTSVSVDHLVTPCEERVKFLEERRQRRRARNKEARRQRRRERKQRRKEVGSHLTTAHPPPVGLTIPADPPVADRHEVSG